MVLSHRSHFNEASDVGGKWRGSGWPAVGTSREYFYSTLRDQRIQMSQPPSGRTVVTSVSSRDNRVLVGGREKTREQRSFLLSLVKGTGKRGWTSPGLSQIRAIPTEWVRV